MDGVLDQLTDVVTGLLPEKSDDKVTVLYAVVTTLSIILFSLLYLLIERKESNAAIDQRRQELEDAAIVQDTLGLLGRGPRRGKDSKGQPSAVAVNVANLVKSHFVKLPKSEESLSTLLRTILAELRADMRTKEQKPFFYARLITWRILYKHNRLPESVIARFGSSAEALEMNAQDLKQYDVVLKMFSADRINTADYRLVYANIYKASIRLLGLDA